MVSVNNEALSVTSSVNPDIEQLWYTWSDMGIDAIRLGFRIRAASPGLADPKSEKVRQLDHYQRYSLPNGADVTVSPDLAPFSLALINTGTERILVNRVYAGRDGVGRYGAFFVHLLANLPPTFSPLDAISLWKSPFWQRADDRGEPQRNSTQLPPLSLASLRQQEHNGRLSGKQFDGHIKKFLPYVIEAYLTKNLLFEKGHATGQSTQSERQKIYIAAPDDLLADLISGLIHTLPPQLVQDLTFSTYEDNINEASTEIVGTCWPSDGTQGQNPAVQQLLPESFFQDKLAINCYMKHDYTELKNSQLIEQHSLAPRFAQDATTHFLTNAPARSKFATLLTLAKKYPQLTISDFLDLYKRIVLRPQKLSPADVEVALSPRYPVEYEISAQHLSEPDYQEKLIELILTLPGWWTKYRPNIINLYKHSGEYPLLGDALATLSTAYAYPDVVNTTQQEVARLQKLVRREKGNPSIKARLELFVDVMACMTPSKVRPDVWLSLLQDLRSIPQISLFISPYWSMYADLMTTWASVLPPTGETAELVSPLLEISWERFADFLALSLPLDWVALAASHLAYKTSTPNPEIISDLEQRSHPQIQNLIQRLTQDSQQRQTVVGLFGALAQSKNYQGKMQLLFLLLDSPIGEDENTVKALLTYAQLNIPETILQQALFLKQYGPRYLPDPKMTKTIMDMFVEVAQSHQQQEKMQVLFAWLASPHLRSWFSSFSSLKNSVTKTTNFSRILQAAQLNAGQGGELLLHFGPTYIPLYAGSQTLISLFKNYAQQRTPQRIEILSTWLSCDVPQKILEQVLDAALLDVEERRHVLLRYGAHYLALYPDAPVLVGYVKEFLAYLQTANSMIFKGSVPAKEPVVAADTMKDVPPKEPSLEEKLLEFLSKRLQPSSDLFYSWHTAAQFVRNPSTLSAEWKRITPALDWLAASVAQEPTRSDLLKELTLACLPQTENTINEQTMATMVLDVSSELKSKRNREQFLLDIAEGTRDGIQRGQYARTLLEPCVLLAFRTKTMFPTEAEQVSWIQRYLGTLFPRNDRRAFKDLSKSSRQWSKPFQADWRRYLSERPAVTAPSPIKQPREYAKYIGESISPSILAAQHTWARAKKHKIAVLSTALILLLVIMFVVYIVQASAQVTLTVAAQNYARPVALIASIDSPAGKLSAQEITYDFHKTGTGQATGTGRIGTAKSSTSICFSNAGNAPINIPNGTTVSTDQGIRFVTTANGTSQPKTSCVANSSATIPVQAVQPGMSENVAANSITTIPDDSLAAIATSNHVTVGSLHLSVVNFNAATGGTAKSASAITAQDRNTVKANLSDQAQADITSWMKDLAKDGVVGTPDTKTKLVNTTAEGTTIGNGTTFPAEVDVQTTVLLVRNADIQKVVLSQLKSAIGKDKNYSSYTVVEDGKAPVSITKLQTNDIDAKSMQLAFSASVVIMPPISKEDVQSKIVGKLPTAAQTSIMDDIPAVKNVAIQVTPGFFPWIIPPWSSRIHVTIQPKVAT